MVRTTSLGSANTLYSVLQAANLTQPLNSLRGTGKAIDGSVDLRGVGALRRDSAQISGPGKVLSQLQQLRAQDPAKFKTVVTNIASQLQAAAKQQGQTPEGQFLSDLANKYQAVANGGSLALLQPNHNGQLVPQAYTPTGQVASQRALAPVSNLGGQGFPSSNLQQLFGSISKEVSQALET